MNIFGEVLGDGGMGGRLALDQLTVLKSMNREIYERLRALEARVAALEAEKQSETFREEQDLTGIGQGR